jgi:hypothetical protein
VRDLAKGLALSQSLNCGVRFLVILYHDEPEELALRDNLRAQRFVPALGFRPRRRVHPDPVIGQPKGIRIRQGHVASDATLRPVDRADRRVLRRPQGMALEANVI